MKEHSCETCVYKNTCEDYKPGRVCIGYKSKPHDDKKIDRNPEGWEPEDEE